MSLRISAVEERLRPDRFRRASTDRLVDFCFVSPSGTFLKPVRSEPPSEDSDSEAAEETEGAAGSGTAGLQIGLIVVLLAGLLGAVLVGLLAVVLVATGSVTFATSLELEGAQAS